MRFSPMLQPSPRPVVLPDPEPFEEAAAAHPQDRAATLAFALSRALQAADGAGDDRPLAMVATGLFHNERGRLSAWGARALGLDPDQVLAALAPQGDSHI